MATTPLYVFALDKTGTNAENLVSGEIHSPPPRQIRPVAPKYGPYFTESLKLYDNATNRLLVRDTDYLCVELLQDAAAMYGKEICSLILIINATVSNNIRVSYQVLGGLYSNNTQALVDFMNSLALDSRPVAWPDVINKPDLFIPADHLHDIDDVYGFEYVTSMLERIRQAILLGTTEELQQLITYIDQAIAAASATTSANATTLNSHISNISNPHADTKAQIGLGSVINLGLATQTDIASLMAMADSVALSTINPDKYVSLQTLLAFKRTLLSQAAARAQTMADVVQAQETIDMNTLTASIASLTTTVSNNKTAQDAVNTTMQTNLATANANLASLVSSTTISVNALYQLNTDRTTDISNLNTTVTNHRALEQADIANLNSQITTLSGTVTSHRTLEQSDIANLAGQITTLTTTVTTNRTLEQSDIAGLSTQIATLNTTVTNHRALEQQDIAALNSLITALTTTVTSHRTLEQADGKSL